MRIILVQWNDGGGVGRKDNLKIKMGNYLFMGSRYYVQNQLIHILGIGIKK